MPAFRKPGETALALRDVIAETPLPFGEGICCLAGFLGETGDSGPNPGLDGRAESREIIAGSRTNYGRNFSHVSESRSRLIMGEFERTGAGFLLRGQPMEEDPWKES